MRDFLEASNAVRLLHCTDCAPPQAVTSQTNLAAWNASEGSAGVLTIWSRWVDEWEGAQERAE